MLQCIIAMLLLALPSARMAAAEETTAPLVLADVIEEARRHNPTIEAARTRARGAAAVRPRVTAYDDPVLSYEAWNAPDSLRLDRADNSIFRVAQRIPF